MNILNEKIDDLNIPLNLKNEVKQFINELSKVFSQDLASAYIYGAAAKDEFIEGVSGVNILVVIKELDIVKIEDIASKAKKYKNKASIIPRFLTEKNVLTGLDVFAIDYYEIQKDGILIAGSDLFSGKKIEEKHLIFQLERDTKAMRMKIVQAYWRNVDEGIALRKVLFTNMRQLLKLLSITLDIKKVEYSGMKDVVKKSSEIIKFNPDMFTKLIETRKSKKQLNKNELALYTRDIFNVIAKIDDFFDSWNK